MSSSRKIRLFSDVGAKMSMFDQRAKEHRDSQMINPFSEWGGAGTRRKLSKEDPEYGRPVEGSKTAERGRLAQIQMIGDMVELCDMIYDCGIRSPDGRAAISFGDAFRLYSAINDKVVGLLMRGRKHKILDFEGEMLFQGRDDNTMIELLLPLNTIRHKYGMPERAGCGEVDHELLQLLAEQDRRQKQQRKQQRTRSVGIPPLAPPAPRHQKSRSVDNGWPGGERPDGEGEGQTQERGRGGKRGAGTGNGTATGAAAGAEEGAQGGEAAGADVEGAAAAASAGGDASERLQHVQQAACSAYGAEGGQDAAGDASLTMNGGDGTPSFLSELLRDHEATFGSNNLPILSGDNAAQLSELPDSADAGRPESTPVPEIRVSQGHVDSSLPTSADTSTDATATAATCETECSPPVGRDEGQRQSDAAAGTSSSAEHQSCAGAVTATDVSSDAGSGSCTAHERDATAEGAADAEGKVGAQPPTPPKIVIEPDPGPDVKSESELQSGSKSIVGENTESGEETGRSAESEPNDKKHEECEQSAELGAEITQNSETVTELEPGGECQSLTEPEPEPESGAVCPRPDPSDQERAAAS